MKKVNAIIGACAASVLLIGITKMALTPTDISDQSNPGNDRYDTLMETGAIEVGFRISGKEIRSSFGKDQYQFDIDTGNGNTTPVEVDNTTYDSYEVGSYITCAYLSDEGQEKIAPRLTGR